MTMTRLEHLEWAKGRALEYVDAGDGPNALTSMLSDLTKHDELRDHAAIELTAMMMVGGLLSDTDRIRRHIEGFN